MIEFGISSACFYPLETEKALELMGKNGVKNAEIFFNALCETKKNFVKQLKSIADYYGMNIVSIHPTMSLAESFMLFSAYDRRKAEGIEQYKRYGEITAELGARYVIMHGGKPNGILSDEQYCQRFLEISDAVAQNGGTLLQENVVNYRAGNIDFLKTMVKHLGERAAFCLDIKQSVRNGYTPENVLEVVGKNVKHLHISDNNQHKDCLLPTKGDYDFSSFFQKCHYVGYNGYAITEVYRNAYSDYDEIFVAQQEFKRNNS